MLVRPAWTIKPFMRRNTRLDAGRSSRSFRFGHSGRTPSADNEPTFRPGIHFRVGRPSVPSHSSPRRGAENDLVGRHRGRPSHEKRTSGLCTAWTEPKFLVYRLLNPLGFAPLYARRCTRERSPLFPQRLLPECRSGRDSNGPRRQKL